MKSRTPPKVTWLFILFTVIWTSCLDVDVSTEVAADGSCERTIAVKGDSSDIFSSRFPIPKDSTWSIDLVKEDKDSYVYTAQKHFADVRELNREFTIEDSDEVAITISTSLKRRFHWFFSSLEYRETYAVNRPIVEVPMSEFLSEEEAAILVRSRTNGKSDGSEMDSELLDDIEERFNRWYARNVFEAFYRPFAAGVDELGHPDLSPEYLASMKERLFENIYESSGHESIEFWIEHFEGVLGSPAVRRVVENNGKPFQLLEEQLELDEELILSEFSSGVSLPGLIVKTNADALEGNRAIWNDIAPFLLYSEFEMLVKSRILNWGITLANAIVLILLAGGLVARAVMLRRV